jgi:hypothetical protein
MNAARSYSGPDRRVGDDAIASLRDHFDVRMDAMRQHVDEKFQEQAEKLDPIHEHYVMAKRGASIIGWLATLGAGVAGAWAAIKSGRT